MSDDPDHDHDVNEVVRFPGSTPDDRDLAFEDRERDTFRMHFSGFQIGPDSLSLAIPETSGFWE
jgi:hypothetical protein